MKIRIIVAAHKPYRMPEGELYLPLQVGAAGKEPIGFARDDTGDHISGKNPNYCELTGLYWAWKNLEADAVGLAHYRRHFSLSPKKDKWSGLLNLSEAEKLLEKSDIVLPKKRNYYIETLFEHYVHTLHPVPLELTGEIIREHFPAYEKAFCNLKKRRSAHMFNMLLMKRDKLDSYCSFLFDVLSRLEKAVPQEEYADPFHARFFGRISELLLDVWLETNGFAYTECPTVHMEGENWGKKISGFLRSKFLGQKYKKSF